MKNLKTKYMGIEINNPIIVGASEISSDLDKLKKAEEFGAGAIVYKSLFEEQVQLENYLLDEKLNEFNDIYGEMLTMHPRITHEGPDEYLSNIRKAKESLSIPLIASLNAVNKSMWIKYAKMLSETGVDGIELNFYQIPSDFNREGIDIENEQISIVKEIRQNISLPISVKLSPDYSNILHFIKNLELAGANAIVLFNSFFQPDIDVDTEKQIKSINLSNEGDYKKSLRYTGILYDNVKADICSSHGIFTGADVVKLILSGASSVQVVSTLYKNGLTQIYKIKEELNEWMDRKKYNSIDEFRGKLSKNMLRNNPFVYKRAQYVDLLINSQEIIANT
jgi:dihydroorotate dehydrogenase (fumarate)